MLSFYINRVLFVTTASIYCWVFDVTWASVQQKLRKVTSGGFLSFHGRCARYSPRTPLAGEGEGEEITDQVLKIISLSSWLSVSW